MIPFAVHTTAETANSFQWTQKLSLPTGGSDPI